MAKNKKPLATTTPKEKDIKRVVFWILAGNSMFDVHEAIAKEYPGKKQREALMAAVLDYFIRSGQANTDVVKGWCLESLRELYRKMVENADYPNAARVIKDIYSMNDKAQG
jgi:hypothetical protein